MGTGTKNDLVRFVLKTTAAAMMLLPIPVAYMICNPFLVLPMKNPEQQLKTNLSLNRGYISVTAYLEGRKQQRYDSFIFGNSQTLAFDTPAWEKAVTSPGKAIQLDASNETIEGILRKIAFIRNNGDTIRNALICFRPAFNDTPNQDVPYRLPWQISDENRLSFHIYYFRQFLRNSFFDIYFNNAHAEGGIQQRIPPDSVDMRHNRVLNFAAEYELENHPELGRRAPFIPGKFHPVQARLSEAQISMLRKIREYLKDTDYRIAIFPTSLYETVPDDNLTLLEDIFGKEKVLDFTSYPPVFTGEADFYDSVHFTTGIGYIISDSIITNFNK